MPKYLMEKVTGAQKALKSSNTTTTPIKISQSPRIPPSGTSVKLNPDSPSSQSSLNLSELEASTKSEEYIQIAHLKPRFSEFTHVFPSFPKTHIDGFAYIIELSEEILNEKALQDLRDALQYSLTNGGGAKVNENVKFFASEGQKTPMKIHYRQCAGILLSC
jgi:hypothetical protein